MSMRYQVQDDDGKLLDAHFELDNFGFDYRARGGSKKSGTQINSDYGQGLRLILSRMTVFFPWSLLFCVVFYGFQNTNFLIIALLHD